MIKGARRDIKEILFYIGFAILTIIFIYAMYSQYFSNHEVLEKPNTMNFMQGNLECLNCTNLSLCGDSICQKTEDCNTCEIDCGKCPTNSSDNSSDQDDNSSLNSLSSSINKNPEYNMILVYAMIIVIIFSLAILIYIQLRKYLKNKANGNIYR